MAISGKQIAQMKEAQFQEEVLIPLFRAMKFKSITRYDGGSLELGKDLVMWKEEDLQERVNYGVVVKAKKISGKATGKGSANEAYFQIRQCFSAPFLDLASTEEQIVHRCWVVSSKEITKEAINAIQSSLRDNNLDRMTTFIGPERLMELISEFMPEQGVFDQLDSVQRKIDQLTHDDHYRVIANSRREFSIEPRYPGAEKDMPFLISARFEFDTKDPQGKKSRDDLLRHFKTGAPIEIRAPYLKEFVLPEFLRHLMKPSTENMVMLLGPARIDERFPFRLEIYRNNEEVARLEYLDFEVIQVGTEETTLANEQQTVPWKMNIVFNKAEKRADFSYKLNLVNANVAQVLQALEFHNAVSEGGELRMVSLETGLDFRVPFPKGNASNIEPRWMRVFEDLAFIQSKTSILIALPERNITSRDARTITTTAEIIRTGRATGKVVSWPVKSHLPQARSALEGFSNQLVHSITLNQKDGQTVTIFGIEIFLGAAVLFCDKTYITKKDLSKLKTAIATAKSDDTIRYSIRPYKGCSTEARYLKWLPPSEVEKLYQLPIFDDSLLANDNNGETAQFS